MLSEIEKLQHTSTDSLFAKEISRQLLKLLPFLMDPILKLTNSRKFLEVSTARGSNGH